MKKKQTVFIRSFIAFLTAVLLTAAPFAAGTAFAREKAISPDAVKTLTRLSEALSEVAEAVRPAVVNISTTSTETMEENPFGDMFNDPLFRHFFGDQFGAGIRGRSGSSSHRRSAPA